MRLKACLAYGEQVLDTVLSLLPYFRLMQQSLESLEDGISTNWSQLSKNLSHFHHKVASYLNRVLSGAGEENHEHLKCHKLADDPLVDQMCQHTSSGHAYNLVIPLK